MSCLFSFNKICLRVTGKCNLSCEFCLVPFSRDSNELSANEILDILSFLKRKSLQSISISGGEPLLRQDIDKILLGAYNLGLPITLATNGTILSKQHLIVLCRSKTRVKVSINGDSNTHNELAKKEIFNNIDNNINKLIQYGIEVSLNTLVTRQNLKALKEVILYALYKGIKRIRFIVFVPRGEGYTHRSKFVLSYKQINYLENELKNLEEYYKDKLSICYSNYFKKTYVVLEPNGHLIDEGAYEKYDKILYNFNKEGWNL
jgi:MoaA/NifB/PqqE/SkfB family radical SAM enzyme